MIDPGTFKVVGHFAVGSLPQHVTPSWDLKTLYVLNDLGQQPHPDRPADGEARPADPGHRPVQHVLHHRRAGTRSSSPSGSTGSTSATRTRSRLHRSLHVPCAGVDHMDFSADGRYLIASCEFSGQVIKVDVRRKVVGTDSSAARRGMPQDVKLSPDGRSSTSRT